MITNKKGMSNNRDPSFRVIKTTPNTAIHLHFLNPATVEQEKGSEKYCWWEHTCETAERDYLKLLELGATPQEARSVLPNSLKTEIIVTMNLRALKNYFTLRASSSAYFQIQWLAQAMKEVTPSKYLDLIIKKDKE